MESIKNQCNYTQLMASDSIFVVPLPYVPDDPDRLRMLGTVSILHSQLDYVLRLTIKTLTGMDLHESLDATQFDSSTDLRKRVRKWGRNSLGECEELLKLQALVTRCERVSERRDDLLHSLYAKEVDGEPMMRGRDRRSTPGNGPLISIAER